MLIGNLVGHIFKPNKSLQYIKTSPNLPLSCWRVIVCVCMCVFISCQRGFSVGGGGGRAEVPIASIYLGFCTTSGEGEAEDGVQIHVLDFSSTHLVLLYFQR